MQQQNFGVNLIGTFQSEKGIGTGVRALASGIQAAKIPLACINYHDPSSLNRDKTFSDFSDENPYLVNLVHLNPDVIPSFAERQGEGFFKNHYNIAFWNWELELFPEKWKNVSRYFHEIWAPSGYTQKAIEKLSIVPVRKIPYPIAVPHSLPEGVSRSTFSLPENALIFLFAFDFQSYRQRKNPEAVIEAFKQAFDGDDRALLLVKTIHQDKDPEGSLYLRSLAQGRGDILFLDLCLSRSEMYALTQLCDVFVSLHRCEGFGLNIFEAMAMQKPVIATGYSSNMDYMDESNSFPVEFTLKLLDRDYGPYPRGAFWADPSIGDAAKKMRLVFDHSEMAVQRAQRAAETITEHLHPERIGRMISNALEEMIRKKEPATYFPTKTLSFSTDLKSHADISHFSMKASQKGDNLFSLFVKKALRKLLRPSLDKQTELNWLLLQRIEEMQAKIDALEKE